MNPWIPMKDALDLKHIGKLGEELNKEWLEDEIADVLANIELNMFHFELNEIRIRERAELKKAQLREWFAMKVNEENND